MISVLPRYLLLASLVVRNNIEENIEEEPRETIEIDRVSISRDSTTSNSTNNYTQESIDHLTQNFY